ncbi:prolipoprotein diacylglyceryl transferase, partial [Chryseobacterium sp. 2TAF14]
MSTILFRTYLVAFALISQCFFSQYYKDGLSDGTLKVNSQDIPVKIFATSELVDLDSFAKVNKNPNTLVILTKSNVEKEHFISSSMILQNYKNAKYEFFDKNLKPVGNTAITADNIEALKYIVRTEKPITSADNVSLETSFKIWDPTSGIHLGPVT